MGLPIICRPRGRPSLKAQGTERAGAPTTFAREVRVRRGLNISDMNSSLVPRPGLSVRGGATSAAVGKMRRSTVVINSRKS